MSKEKKEKIDEKDDRKSQKQDRSNLGEKVSDALSSSFDLSTIADAASEPLIEGGKEIARSFDKSIDKEKYKLYKKVNSEFAWATDIIFTKFDPKDIKKALKEIKKPENKKLFAELNEIYLALLEVRKQFFTDTYREPENRLLQEDASRIQERFAYAFMGILLNDEFRYVKEMKTFLNNYHRHRRIAIALAGKNDSNMPDIQIETTNYIIKSLETTLKNPEDKKIITELLEWIRSIPKAGPLFSMLSPKWARELIHRNMDFITSYMQKTEVIYLSSSNFIPDLIEKFPFPLIDNYKPQLEELAQKYQNKGILRGLLLYKIHDEADLKFYLDHSDYISKFYEDLSPNLLPERVIEISPSRIILENHFDEVQTLMKRMPMEIPELFKFLNDTVDVIEQYGNFYFQCLNIISLTDGLQGCYSIYHKFFKDKETSTIFFKHKEKVLFFLNSRSLGLSSIAQAFQSLSMPGEGRQIRTGIELNDIAQAFQGHPDITDKDWEIIKQTIEEFPEGKFNAGLLSRMFKGQIAHNSLADNREAISKAIKLATSIESLFYHGYSAFDVLVMESPFTPERKNKVIELIDDFFDDEGELADISDPEERREYQLRAQNLSIFLAYYLEAVEDLPEELFEYARYLKDSDIKTIEFLKKQGCDEDTIEDYLDEAQELYRTDPQQIAEHPMKYLLVDYTDGSDLRYFDYTKTSSYKNIFIFLRENGLSDFEEEIIENFKFEKFQKAVAGKDFFEVEKIIKSCEVNIDPRLGTPLFKATILGKNDEPWIGKVLAQWISKDPNGHKKIDVTQNNLAQINGILRLFSRLIDLADKEKKPEIAKQVTKNIQFVFPEFAGTGNPETDLKWFLEKLDVEEINFKQLDSLTEFIEFQQLFNTMTENKISSSTRYLENKFRDIDFDKMSFEGVDYSIFELGQIEELRQLINSKSKIAGDMIVDMIGSRFLEQNCCDYQTLPKLLHFAHAWEAPGVNRDVDGLYQVYSTYAYVEIASFIKEKIEKGKSGRETVEEELKRIGINPDDLIKELESKGYLVLTEGNVSKAISNIGNGMISYTFRKGAQKILGGSAEFDNKKISIGEADWTLRDGVKVYSIKGENGDELAKIIKCDPSKTKVKILAEANGMVKMSQEARVLGGKLIFSAPLTFTTGARKMTELAFRDGIQMNYLLSPYSKDGFLLVNKDGEQKVLNKKKLKVSDLITTEDLKDEKIKEALSKWARGNKIQIDENDLSPLLQMSINPVQKFLDKNTFFTLIRLKKYSLLGGMLLIDKEAGKDEGTIVKLDDGGDSRRFYLEFDDGQFGIIDSTESMSSGKMVELALLMGATRAIYMDTGMYDMATYKDGKGEDHVMGHQDTSESTNRVVIYAN